MSTATCVLCGKPGVASRPAAPVYVDDAERQWAMHVHDACLSALFVADVPPLAASRLPGIPGKAACGVCGGRLPIIGQHPYALTRTAAGDGQTWFVHAECVPEPMRARMSKPPH